MNDNPDTNVRPRLIIHMEVGPNGTEEYGYSEGLVDTLGHELLMWTRPTHGTDQGLDMVRGEHALRRRFREIVDVVGGGRFAFNSPIEIPLRNGRQILTVGEPVVADDLGASALAPHMLVAPIRWELQRNDFGPLSPVAPAELPRLTSKCRQLSEKLPVDAVVPVELRVDTNRLGEADFDITGPYGPTTPLVCVVAATIATAPDYVIEELVARVADLREVGDYQHILEVELQDLARNTGRSAAVSRCEDLARRLSGERSEADDAEKLTEAIRSTLMTAAVDDLLSQNARHRGYGPWETSLYFPERPPGQEAAPHLVDALASLLTPLSGAALQELCERYEGGASFQDLDAYAISHATGLSEGHPFLDRLGDVTGRSSDDYRGIITMLLSAGAWIREDGAQEDDVSAQTGWWVLDAYGDLIPGLESFVTRWPRPVTE